MADEVDAAKLVKSDVGGGTAADCSNSFMFKMNSTSGSNRTFLPMKRNFIDRMNESNMSCM